jgi:hypothetical protein
VTTTLTQTPVTGSLVEGGTFEGLLTVRELTVDGRGQLAASGDLAGTATPAPGTVTPVPPHPFTPLVRTAMSARTGACLQADGPIFASRYT